MDPATAAAVSAVGAMIAAAFAGLAWFAPRGSGSPIILGATREREEIIVTNHGWRVARNVTVTLAEDGRTFDLGDIGPDASARFVALGSLAQSKCGFRVRWSRLLGHASRDLRA